MYKIGEFSRILNINVKTLRYYDQIGLLKPSIVDNFTNYRYYTDLQLEQYRQIEYLKKLGFTLEQIKQNISNMTIQCLEQKKAELCLKRDYIIAQIAEIDNYETKLRSKVLSKTK